MCLASDVVAVVDGNNLRLSGCLGKSSGHDISVELSEAAVVSLFLHHVWEEVGCLSLVVVKEVKEWTKVFLDPFKLLMSISVQVLVVS